MIIWRRDEHEQVIPQHEEGIACICKAFQLSMKCVLFTPISTLFIHYQQIVINDMDSLMLLRLSFPFPFQF